MVSRRKILSRSRDDLNLQGTEPDEEDVWYQKDKLFKEHIQEVLNKWESIDDEIWAKIIVLERNRRVAKAYARAPVLTVNGSDDGFDGFRIGLAGFDNPMRDPRTEEVKKLIGQGCKIKMDDSGNILVKRIAKSNVYVKTASSEDNAVSSEILKLPNAALEPEKPVKLFDMKKFQQNVSREMKRSYPDRRKLETQCVSTVAFVRNEGDILDCPCWIMLINVVAMDMLKSKMPSATKSNSQSQQRPSQIDIRNRPRIPIPDEDPYSIAGSGSSGGSGGNGGPGGGGGGGGRERSKDKPPKLPPPRDRNDSVTKPDYDELEEERGVHRREQMERGKQSKKDDPYYCGLRARIPNFAKSKAQKEKEAAMRYAQQQQQQQGPPAAPPGAHPMMAAAAWQRGYMDNVPPGAMGGYAGTGGGYAGAAVRNGGRPPFDRNPTTWVPQAPMRSDYSESDYSHIYGRLPYGRPFPAPANGRSSGQQRQVYVSEWE